LYPSAWVADASMSITIIVGSLDMPLFSNEEVARHHAWPFARQSGGKISFAFVYRAFSMALLGITAC